MKLGKSSLFDAEYILKYVFVAIAIGLAVVTFLVTDNLVRNLARDEHASMEVWANATRQLINADNDCNIAFAQDVIAHNNHIPVILCDSAFNVISSRNVDSTLTDMELSSLAMNFAADNEPIVVDIMPGYRQYICYGKSRTLKWIALFPYVQLAVLALFVTMVLVVLLFFRRSEQNKVWAGLSKETAHQLGTPISSLLAWSEILKEKYPDDTMLLEMDKDVNRLRTIAERFSQIGSMAELSVCDMNELLTQAVGYMGSRVSKKVRVTYHPVEPMFALVNIPLLEWVVENLCKNAADAMDGEGTIDVYLRESGHMLSIDVVDTGKGISKKNQKYIFNPGFTTKRRGWGLGLSLARRIVEDYHKGRIFVARSVVGEGTTFRIELRKAGV